MHAQTRLLSVMVFVAAVAAVLGAVRPAAGQCMADWECLWEPWVGDCIGDWDCIMHLCEQNCDSAICGDGICDAAEGETMESCGEDCVDPTCVDASNCIGQDWPALCWGHWECAAGECLPSCELQACDDGFCDAYGGENRVTCPQDCNRFCQADIDCLINVWPLGCGGHWDCVQEWCVPNCYDNTCGDRFCDRQAGEADDSCPIDCPSPNCEQPVDCLNVPWLLGCGGHWDCVQGRCVENCQDGLCGDGICEPFRGEGSHSCPPDCPHQCDADIHCVHMPWVLDCIGQWDCLGGRCLESCDSRWCGNNLCDYLEGESVDSCSTDCEPCVCGDLNGSGGQVDLNDFATFALCVGASLPTSWCQAGQFVCSDLNASGMVSLDDFATFAVLFGRVVTQWPPGCVP